ncbi:alpha/beta hydrolase [Mycolicibacterium moriokaense]|nr:alpha/beta hydrolase [Mycolicibacterium moriokaense]
MPRGKGLVTRRLRLSRMAVAAAERVLGVRGVEVVAVSPTAGVRVHRPRDAQYPAPAVLWIHGGGYVLGSARIEDRKCRRMADRLGVVVAAVDYRLAPERPHPAALDDCYAALAWLAETPQIDARRIVVAGVSAGGGLAAALSMRCIDNGLVDLAGQVLQYPMLDDRTAVRRLPSALGWTAHDNRFGWRSYLAGEPGADSVGDYASPARRSDLADMPPTWIGVGTADMFHDENVDFAARLEAAGVPTHLEVVPGAFHGFDVTPGNELARSFKAAQLDAIGRFLG